MVYKKNYFTKKECKKIIEFHKIYKDYGYNFDWYNEVYDKDNRINTQQKFYAYLIPNVPYTKWLYDKIQLFFEETTGIKFVKPLRHCQLYKYVAGDEFPQHIDLSEKFPNRRWNMGVHLNSEYEGGEYLCWDGMDIDTPVREIPKDTGTICIYHSRQLHEIKKINSGERWSLVIKIEQDFIDNKKQLI